MIPLLSRKIFYPVKKIKMCPYNSKTKVVSHPVLNSVTSNLIAIFVCTVVEAFHFFWCLYALSPIARARMTLLLSCPEIKQC